MIKLFILKLIKLRGSLLADHVNNFLTKNTQQVLQSDWLQLMNEAILYD